MFPFLTRPRLVYQALTSPHLPLRSYLALECRYKAASHPDLGAPRDILMTVTDRVAQGVRTPTGHGMLPLPREVVGVRVRDPSQTATSIISELRSWC